MMTPIDERRADYDWHLSGTKLTAYVDGRADDARTWSAETHLLACPDCRARLAGLVVDSPVGGIVGAARTVLMDLPPTVRRPRASLARRASLLATVGPARRSAALAVVLATAVGLAVLGVMWQRTSPLLLLVLPLLPLVGVGACHGPGNDPADEVLASTPFAGLRLLLWRTLAVLAVAVPAATVVGVATGAASPEIWLLPSLALTAATLALGSVVALPLAAGAVAGTWGLLVAVPSLVRMRSPVLLDPEWQVGWLLLVAVAGAVCQLRRDAYARRVPTTLRSVSS